MISHRLVWANLVQAKSLSKNPGLERCNPMPIYIPDDVSSSDDQVCSFELIVYISYYAHGDHELL